MKALRTPKEYQQLQEDWKNILKDKNYTFATLELFCFELKRDLDQVRLLKTIEKQFAVMMDNTKNPSEEEEKEIEDIEDEHTD